MSWQLWLACCYLLVGWVISEGTIASEAKQGKVIDFASVMWLQFGWGILLPSVLIGMIKNRSK